MLIAVLPLARETFDIELARSIHLEMMDRLAGCQHRILGGGALITDTESLIREFDRLGKNRPDRVLILQVTFTDAEACEYIAGNFSGPLSIWAVDEPRTGDRLRLNSFCGLNLASHAMSMAGRGFGWLYGQPARISDVQLQDLLEGSDCVPLVPGHTRTSKTSDGRSGYRIGVIGGHPDGFATCRYDAGELVSRFGTETVPIDLDDLFMTASELTSDDVKPLLADISAMDGYDQLPGETISKSLKLKIALDRFRSKLELDGFALRCWPETFTRYGAAACACPSLLGDCGIPCACECDVYGALSQLVLISLTGKSSFLADIVDMDTDDNTGVVWHCGQAPLSMCDAGSRPELTIHSNRLLPLLFQFPLREGQVTLMRISQSHGDPKLVLLTGRMLQRPLAYSGTSGVVRFDRRVEDVLPDMISCGLEHHVALCYGDHRPQLRKFAEEIDLPVLEL